jgi:hypothetical protein
MTVVDANILKAFYEKNVLSINQNLTGCPEQVFSRLRKIYIDDGGKIEHEWRSLVDQEWFNVWLAREITSGRIESIPVKNHQNTCKKLRAYGFPSSKDIWYIRTAKEISIINNSKCVLLTEDIDFFDPKKKSLSGNARVKVLKSNNSNLKKILEKEENIAVMCIFIFLTIDF